MTWLINVACEGIGETLIRVSETEWFLCSINVNTLGNWAYFSVCKCKYQCLGTYGNEQWRLRVLITLGVGEKFRVCC